MFEKLIFYLSQKSYIKSLWREIQNFGTGACGGVYADQNKKQGSLTSKLLERDRSRNLKIIFLRQPQSLHTLQECKHTV